jgi:hypothetical protein
MEGTAMAQVSRRSLLLGSLVMTLTMDEAEAGSWKWLGSRRVRIVADRDVIPVTVLNGLFQRIKLRVSENGVHISDLNVIYANGAPDHIPMRYHIPAGGESRAINLRGWKRYIRKVEIIYRPVHNGKGHAKIDLYGWQG